MNISCSLFVFSFFMVLDWMLLLSHGGFDMSYELLYFTFAILCSLSKMANPNNVELEAAKFLHKLIQESKDEPTKLATKLYVVCIHLLCCMVSKIRVIFLY